ncbi:MAG: response regulator [Chthoniobacterales bacterium]
MSTPKRILLIDHEPHLTAMVGSALEASGQYLIQKEDYSPGVLDIALHFQPDLILLDAEPQHLEIDEVAQRIHADRALHDVPVVCLTSLAQNGQIGSIGFLGGYTFVANPFHLDDMVRCIAEILAEKRARRVSA